MQIPVPIMHLMHRDEMKSCSPNVDLYPLQFTLPAERAEDHQPMKIDVSIVDDFDYTQLEKTILEDEECEMLLVGAQSESLNVEQRQTIAELERRIVERYRTVPRFESLSCNRRDNDAVPKCKHNDMIIAIDQERCGAFLQQIDANGCSVRFCVP
ncbi:unnamed protein product [Anisakis simplex]|uniref:Uncharacterized protein n=1 Tax=Anisakis simplex TaxID=6269 RepID=A0A0M3JIW8_ANISI|nr:unnamed protein product [Anisakis simplex]